MRYAVIALSVTLLFSGCSKNTSNIKSDSRDVKATDYIGKWEVQGDDGFQGRKATIDIKPDFTFTTTAKLEGEADMVVKGKWKILPNKKVELAGESNNQVEIEPSWLYPLDANTLGLYAGSDIPVEYNKWTAKRALAKKPELKKSEPERQSFKPLASVLQDTQDQTDQTKPLSGDNSNAQGAAAGSFVGAWLAKKPGIGFTSNRMVFQADGKFTYVSSNEEGPQVQMHGTWKASSTNSVEITNESLRAIGREIASAKLLDPKTLELDTYGTKAEYTRDSVQPKPATQKSSPTTANKSKSPTTPTDPIAARLRRLKFTRLWKKEGKPTPSTLNLYDDGRASFQPLPGTKEPKIEGAWDFVSENTIEIRRRAKESGSIEVYATGELVGDKTLLITIEGQQIKYTR